MRKSGISDAQAARRRHAIVRALSFGQSVREVASAFELTPRYICLIARDAGISQPVGRPLGRTKAAAPARLRPTRSGYSLHAAGD